MNKKTIVRGFLKDEEHDEQEPVADAPSYLDTWIADWMNLHPAAHDLQHAKDTITTMEILHQCIMETGQVPLLSDIQDALIKAEYTFEGGAWLVR